MSTPQSVPSLGPSGHTRPPGRQPCRAGTRELLSRAAYDLLVICGGILGTSVARHAAQSGLRVTMTDAGDSAGVAPGPAPHRGRRVAA